MKFPVDAPRSRVVKSLQALGFGVTAIVGASPVVVLVPQKFQGFLRADVMGVHSSTQRA
jgi:hypothetical protein